MQVRGREGAWSPRHGAEFAADFTPIPLRDPDAQLTIQAVLPDICDQARHATYVYDGSPAPPLSPEDETWARQFVPGNSA